MIIDTHAHLTDAAYDNVDKLIEELKSNNVEKVFLASSDAKTSEESFNLSQKYKQLYAILGVHPSETKSYTHKFVQFLKKVATNPKVIAIGEIGLDYHYEDTNKEEQKKCFISQIKLADELGLPIVLHIRDAMGDAIEILQENQQFIKKGGIVHCYSGSYESYKILKTFGFKFAFGGAITFKNNKTASELISKIPLSDILLETDCPYLTPEPYRGKEINEPKYANLVASRIADFKNISIAEVEKVTTQNAKMLFPKVEQGGK